MGLYRTGVSSNGGGSITVDDQLSTTSTNPVQNKVITEALNNTNSAVSGKQDALTAGTGISINNNVISVDNSSMGGYQKFIGSDIATHTGWSAGTIGELRYEEQTDGSRHLYRYENGAWTRVFEITVHAEGSPATNVPLTDIVITSNDIGEGVSLDAGTIVLVVE